MFETSEKLRFSNNQMSFLECLESAGKNSLWKQLFLVNDEEVISLSRMQRFMYFRILCYVLEKMNQNPTSNTAWEQQLDWFEDSIAIQNIGHNWRRRDGIRVECFPRIHHIAVHQLSPRVHDENGWHITISRTNYLHVDVQWPLIWRSEDNERECIANSTRVTLFAKRFPPGSWSYPWIWIRKEFVFYLQRKTTRKMGQSPLNWWWSNSEKADTQFSRATSPLSRGTLTSKGEWKIICTLLRWPGNDWNCFSHNYFC